MIPVSTLVAVVFVALRLVLALREGNGGAQGKGSFGAWAVFVWLVLAPTGLALAILSVGAPLLLLPAALMALVVFPWPIARAVLVPLGQPRLAYYLTYASDFVFYRDRQGGASIAAAWALSMQPKLDEEDARWLSDKLAAEEPLRGAGLVAHALLLAARGDREGARALLAAVDLVDPRVCPPAAKRVANGWLAADAAERGDWPRVAELGDTLSRGGRLAWLLSGVAQSLLLEPMAPDSMGLWLRWAIAPRRSATKPMVERAIQARNGAFIEPEDDAPLAPITPTDADDALATALSLHAAVLARRTEELRADDVRAALSAWDAALGDGVTERRLLERALVLGASGGSTIARVRDAIEGDLTAVVLASGLPLAQLGEGGDVASRVRARLRDGLLTEIEAASDAIRRRVDDQRSLPAADEWREWANLAARYRHGVARAGMDLRRLAFAKVHPDACAYAVWLFNERKERPLGNAIFRFLLAEAEAQGDQRAIALQTKNVACGV
jgi:hypothetical protein